MFAKVFEQIFDSSIAEEWQTRVVFEDLLILADKNGVVDRTPEAISRRTNVPLEIIKKAISELESPDLRSRRIEHEGRRLVRLDEHRDWGWLIVNYDYYRSLASEEQRREVTALRVRKFREKKKCNASVTLRNDSPYAYTSSSISSLKGGCKGAKPKTFKQWNSEDLSNAVKAIEDILDAGQEQSFVDYWTEPMPSGKPRLFAEKAWDTKRRMRTWARNNERNTYKQPKPTRSAGFKVSRDVAIGQAIDALDHAAESTDDDAVSRCLSVLNDKYRDVGKNREGQMVATEAYEVWKFRGKKNRR